MSWSPEPPPWLLEPWAGSASLCENVSRGQGPSSSEPARNVQPPAPSTPLTILFSPQNFWGDVIWGSAKSARCVSRAQAFLWGQSQLPGGGTTSKYNQVPRENQRRTVTVGGGRAGRPGAQAVPETRRDSQSWSCGDRAGPLALHMP